MKIMSKEWRKLSRAGRNKYFKRWKKADRRKRRAVAFICPDCLRGFNAFEKCKIQKVFCGECGKAMISEEQLYKYSLPQRFLYVWRVTDPNRFRQKMSIEFWGLKRPPQSWCYTNLNF